MHGRVWICGLVAVLAAACGEADPGRSDAPGARGGIAAVGVAAGPTTPLPPLAAAALDFEIGSALYLGLNWAEWRDGRLVYPAEHPLALAREWEVDGATLTYRLHPGRTWSDGTAITAGDVAFTYELLADDSLALPLSFVAARIDSVTVPDDATVVFHFDAPYPGMLYDTGVGILPAHVYRGGGMDALRAIPENGGLVVSGPYGVAAWSASRVVLERNERSPAPGLLDRVEFRVLPDETARAAALRGGEIHLAQVNDYAVASRLERQGMRLAAMPQRGYDYIAWNPAAHPAFADPRVREALSLAIDRDAILEALSATRWAEKARGPYGSLFGELAPDPPEGGWHDPSRARELLAAAGWTDGNGDGVREAAGRELAFSLSVPAGNERRETAAEAVQAQLAEVGVAAEIRLEEFNSLFARARGGEYEAALLGWQVGLDPDISPFWYDADSPVNLVGYEAPAVRAAIDSARAAATYEDAAPHWRRAAARIAADHPYAFLWFLDVLVAARPELRGVEVDPLGFTRSIHRWSLVGEAADAGG